MSRIKIAFENGKAFIGFLTAGDPSIEKTGEFIRCMVEGGADLIEIGVPFSDPVAEGPVIQGANLRALSQGVMLDDIFSLVENVRRDTEVSIVFLTYLNPVFCYGYGEFFRQCDKSGVDGVIIPDLPYEEKGELAKVAEAYQVDLISMVAPTSGERIKKIAGDAKGFLYLVSSMGVTGVREHIQGDVRQMVSMAKAAADIPVAVGFGINTPEQAGEMAALSDGVIVGSALVGIIEEFGNDAGQHLYEYVRRMKGKI